MVTRLNDGKCDFCGHILDDGTEDRIGIIPIDDWDEDAPQAHEYGHLVKSGRTHLRFQPGRPMRNGGLGKIDG